MILNHLFDGIIVFNEYGTIEYFNPVSEHIFGYMANEVIGQKIDMLLPQPFFLEDDEYVCKCLASGNVKMIDYGYEIAGRKKDGTVFPLQIIVSEMWEETWRENLQPHLITFHEILETESTFICAIHDISERKQAEETIRNLSLTDELTGIYNRRGFRTFTEQILKIAVRIKNAVVLFFADVDRLKWINDNLGHKYGDMAILDVADILKNTFRESDVIARVGGDEFAVLTMVDSLFKYETLMTRLLKNIEVYNKKRPYCLSVSVGMVRHDFSQPKTIDDLLSEADKLMYEEKQKKKEQIVASDECRVTGDSGSQNKS